MAGREEKLWIFNGKNFSSWKYRIEILMEDKKLLDCLENAIEDEAYATVDPEDTAEMKAEKERLLDERWSRDRRCMNLLVNRIAEDQLDYVMDKKTAKDAWEALKNVFERVGIPGKLYLKQRFQGLKLAEGGDIQRHLLEFEKILREMKAAGVKNDREDVVCQLLLSLPESFEPLIVALETVKSEELTLDYVKKRLLDEQIKRSNRSGVGSSSESAFVGKKAGARVFKCFGCGKVGHKRSKCPDQADDDAGRRKKHAGKSNRRFKAGANVSSSEDVIAFVGKAREDPYSVPEDDSTISARKIEWFLDSGATDHMMKEKELFVELHPLKKKVHIAVAKSGQSLAADTAGTVNVSMLVDGKLVSCTVDEVLYVPNLSCNLFSVRRLEDKGMTVEITAGTVHVKKNGKVVCVGHRKDQLYSLDVFYRGSHGALVTKQDSFELWHRRFGHLGETNMKMLWNNKMVQTAAEIRNWPEKCICEVCLAGKQTRQPFVSRKEPRSSRALELIHSDVCGPFTPTTWNKKRSFVTFIDDFTHYTMVYVLEGKDEVQEKFEQYYERVTALFGTKVARLRCDNGKEYINKSFEKFCQSKGIAIESTVPYSPQQNGVAERMNRTLMEKARSMLLDAGLPKSLWNEAVLTAAYLLNRSPTTALPEKKTPFEMWYGRKPDVDNVRVFGSEAHTWIPKEKRSKLDARSERNVFIGYSPNGYRIWSPVKKIVFTSRDVVFDERRKVLSEQPVPADIVPYESEDEDQPVPERPRRAAVPAERQVGANADEQPVRAGQPVQAAGVRDTVAAEEEPTEALPLQHERDNCPAEVSTRRSERERKAPGRFLDYITSFRSSSAGASFAGIDDSPVYAYALSAETFVEDLPSTVEELMQRDDWDQWKAAINSELESLEKNETWDLVPKPAGKNLVDCKWVFRIKRDEAGNVDKYKARLVAKGYSQRKGFDYEETYAPVAKITTVRVLLAVANQKDYVIHQMDVKTAFLNGTLKEEIFMRQPDGFEKRATNLVCRLKKSLYGLKQSPRSWNEEFNRYVLQLKFKRSSLDSCLYWRKEGGTVVYLLLYVDDILLVSSCLKSVKVIKSLLSSKFEMTDMGEMKHFLGLKVDWNKLEGKMKISQPKYIVDLLKRFGMADCKPTATPLDPNLKLDIEDNAAGTEKPFRELVGCLTYLSVASRPDICAAVNFFSKYQSAPTDVHWTHLKRILRYLKGTVDLGLTYTRADQEPPLSGYADADWGNDPSSRRSISGNVFQVYGGTVSWCTRKQTSVALSSTEAEYIALSQAVCEGIWLRGLLQELGVGMDHPVPLFEDNQSCIRIAEEGRDNKRMKHVDIRYCFTREKLQEGLFKMLYIPTTEQTADIFTKGLPRRPFEHLRLKLGLQV